MRKLDSIAILAALAMGCGSGGPAEEPAAAAKAVLVAHVTNYPIQYYAGRIGGDRVEVKLPVPAGANPVDWSPDAETVAAFQRADLIFLNGADYEKWVAKVSLPASKLVDTSVGFADRFLVIENAITHSHGPEGEHSHGETASMVWLDPTLAIGQAKAIRDALSKALPESEAYFQERFQALELDLAELDASLRESVAERTDRPLLAASHAYPYLARRYGLDIDTVLYDPADMTAGDFWHDLEHKLEEHKARLMLWERAPSPETAEKLRGYGVESVVLDPAGAPPGEGDFLTVMKGNVGNLREAFGRE